jgi:acylphosphatase
MKARKYLISGLVQGVGYRFFVEKVARSLGVKGYVKNLWDGRVEVFAEAEDNVLNELESRLRVGPPAADVDKVEIIEEEPKGFKDFKITF